MATWMGMEAGLVLGNFKVGSRTHGCGFGGKIPGRVVIGGDKNTCD